MSAAFIDLYRFHARYNCWINERIYTSCEQLTDQQRKLDRGAFFGSIHRTLNHLVVTDQVWLRRFARSGVETGTPFPALEGELIEIPEAYALDMVPFDDWQALKAKRVQLDAAMEAWTHAMPEGYPLMTMAYSNSRGMRREHPAWQAITHLFNHQTHHRSQVITLLTQAGIDFGVTDMLALM
ncbi:MAG: DinB family protein [Pseudomonadota bacterium]